jgi:hypothetical protein
MASRYRPRLTKVLWRLPKPSVTQQGAPVTLFNHHGGTDTQYITRFQIRQGDRSASFSWETRDGQPREVLVFQSTQGFIEDGVDPAGDYRQQLVYQGSDLHARLTDADPSGDVAYYYSDDIAYYYSVFAKGDDGDWCLQLTGKAAPRSVGCWQRPVDKGSGSPAQISDAEIDRELASLSRR